MKKVLIIAVVLVLSAPTISHGAVSSRADLEAQQMKIMQELIVLLKAQIEFLKAQIQQKQTGLVPVTTTSELAGADNEAPKKQPTARGKRGGGGGSSRLVETVAEPVEEQPTDPEPVIVDYSNLSLTYAFNPITGTIKVSDFPESFPDVESIVVRVFHEDGRTEIVTLERQSKGVYEAQMGAGFAFWGYERKIDILEPTNIRALGIRELHMTLSGFGTLTILEVVDSLTEAPAALFLEDTGINPDASAFLVNATDDSDLYTVFAFDVDNGGVGHAIVAEADISAAADPEFPMTSILSSAQCVVDGQAFPASIHESGVTCGMIVVVEGGSSETVELQVSFLPTTFYASDWLQQVQFSIQATDIIAVHYDTSEEIVIGGEFVVWGWTHVLAEMGAYPGLVDYEENLVVDGNDDENVGEFEIEFDVTAFATDLYIDDSAEWGEVADVSGVNYVIRDFDDSLVTDGTVAATLDSTANFEDGRFKVEEGETETFTLTVSYDPVSSGFYKVQLYSINWSGDNADPELQLILNPEEEFETDYLNI